MVVQRWPTVYPLGLKLNQHWGGRLVLGVSVVILTAFGRQKFNEAVVLLPVMRGHAAYFRNIYMLRLKK